MPEYTFSKLSISNYKEKGSSFYAVAHPATSINDVKNKLSTIKEEYPDASHICYAYRIKLGQPWDLVSMSYIAWPIQKIGRYIPGRLTQYGRELAVRDRSAAETATGSPAYDYRFNGIRWQLGFRGWFNGG